jgi:hypothetical protein
LRALPGRPIYRVVGWVLAVVVIGFVGYQLAGYLRELRTHPLPSDPRWGCIALSGVVFLSAHAVLVQTWRSVLSSWDARLPFWTAARIWSVSSLGRHLPGKIWHIGAMAAMSREIGVSPVAASASAILGTIVNVLAGFVVALVGGRALLEQSSQGRGAMAVLLVIVGSLALLAAPVVLPRIAPLAGRALGRPLTATLPPRAVTHALVGNIIAWLLYGAAFQLFTTGILGRATGGYPEYLAAYTISYLVGYLALFAPAGLGVREGTMVTVLTFAGLATAPQAALIALTSRVWLTLLEIIPGFLFWAHASVRRRPPTTDSPDVTT